jgi:hypothetical protein
VGRTCGMHGEGRGVYRVLIGIPERKRSLRRPGVCGTITLRWTLRKSGLMR